MKKSGLADSPFFTLPSQRPQIVEHENPMPVENEQKSERTEIRSEKRTPIRTRKRRTIRYSFQFYEDQISKLKQLKYQSEIAGDNLNLYDLAREAFDQYLKDKSV